MSSETNPRNGFENAVFAAGLVVVVGLLVALGAEAVRRPEGPAVLSVAVGRTQGAGPAVVPITVTNTGGRVAEAVRVEVCASGGDPCAEVEIPYVPVGAEQQAEVGFRARPVAPVEARVVSLIAP